MARDAPASARIGWGLGQDYWALPRDELRCRARRGRGNVRRVTAGSPTAPKWVRVMQPTPAMKIPTNMKRVLKGAQGAIVAMQALPFIVTRRQRMSVAAYVLGGIGFAVVGGIAALMLISPRTRHRALESAKGTYGKVNEKLNRLRPMRSGGAQTDEIPLSNGLSGQGPDYPTTSGL